MKLIWDQPIKILKESNSHLGWDSLVPASLLLRYPKWVGYLSFASQRILFLNFSWVKLYSTASHTYTKKKLPAFLPTHSTNIPANMRKSKSAICSSYSRSFLHNRARNASLHALWASQLNHSQVVISCPRQFIYCISLFVHILLLIQYIRISLFFL